jgi:hypothetical protein
MTTKAVRAKISIAGIEIEVFQLPDGEYVMSQSQVAEAVDLDAIYIRRFLDKERTKYLPGKAFELDTLDVEGSNKPINAVPTESVSSFWLEQATKGNNKALALVAACMREALQRRCDNAFSITKTEQQYEQQTADWLEQWLPVRQYLSEQHVGFCRACDDYGFPRASTHDMLAMAACGMKASELKKLEKVCGDKNVGLNHIKDIAILKRFAIVKRHFSRYQKGSIELRIDRALKDTDGEMKAS